jgi:dCTP deaminase
MTVLSGSELRRRLKTRDLSKRLVVSPILEPDEQVKDDRASIDVRLGFEFALMSPSLIGAIDEMAFGPKAQRHLELAKLYSRSYVPFGKALVIHPHQFILAGTLEYLRLPRDLMSYVVGRSTWGRLGLTIATAIGIHPGFAGTLTLELRNLGEIPLTLHPGDTVAQLFFHLIDGPESGRPGETTPNEAGQYVGTVDLIPRTMSPSATFEKLFRMQAARLERERQGAAPSERNESDPIS